jgi:hypothetical protein
MLRFIAKVILYVPMVIAGIILYIAEDFKKHKLGYVFLFILFGLIVWGIVEGIAGGPSGSVPWND